MEWFSPVDLLEFLPVLYIPCERNCRMWKLRLECHIISKSNVESSGWEKPKEKWKLSVNKLETGRRKAAARGAADLEQEGPHGPLREGGEPGRRALSSRVLKEALVFTKVLSKFSCHPGGQKGSSLSENWLRNLSLVSPLGYFKNSNY